MAFDGREQGWTAFLHEAILALHSHDQRRQSNAEKRFAIGGGTCQLDERENPYKSV